MPIPFFEGLRGGGGARVGPESMYCCTASSVLGPPTVLQAGFWLWLYKVPQWTGCGAGWGNQEVIHLPLPTSLERGYNEYILKAWKSVINYGLHLAVAQFDTKVCLILGTWEEFEPVGHPVRQTAPGDLLPAIP